MCDVTCQTPLSNHAPLGMSENKNKKNKEEKEIIEPADRNESRNEFPPETDVTGCKWHLTLNVFCFERFLMNRVYVIYSIWTGFYLFCGFCSRSFEKDASGTGDRNVWATSGDSYPTGMYKVPSNPPEFVIIFSIGFRGSRGKNLRKLENFLIGRNPTKFQDVVIFLLKKLQNFLKIPYSVIFVHLRIFSAVSAWNRKRITLSSEN